MEEYIKSIIGVNVKGLHVLFRPDINSPINDRGEIVNDNRLIKSLSTLRYLIESGAKTAIIAHQGDTLDYQNLIPLKPHAERLSQLLNKKVEYIDDVCGDYAIERIKQLKPGDVIILGNLRYLTEEVSTFEKDVKLTSQEMERTYLIRRLSPHFDLYVNDAFSAAHRNSPSMTGFQRLLPSYAGTLFFEEFSALSNIMVGPKHPTVFVLGGAKISDAFGMMEKVLNDSIADTILACGVTGIVMQIANGIDVGTVYSNWLKSKDLLAFVDPAKKLLDQYEDKFLLPIDFACNLQGTRGEIGLNDLSHKNTELFDIGKKTIELFVDKIRSAGTVFVNGPPGVYENSLFEYGTKMIFNALASTEAYTVIGGGDTVSAATKYIDLTKINYICTAGGAMIRFLSGKKLPLIEAFKS
jgi:phosphoglycerate kinase